MTELLAKIEQEVRELSREERERLAADLLAGLADEPLSKIDQAWIEEAERRFNDLSAGRTQGVPANMVFDKIRREFGWNKLAFVRQD